MTAPVYDPIPAEVRAAWRAFSAACEAAGFHRPSILLHQEAPLAEGEDCVVCGKGHPPRAVRYWPDCGGFDAQDQLAVCSPSPESAADAVPPAAREEPGKP